MSGTPIVLKKRHCLNLRVDKKICFLTAITSFINVSLLVDHWELKLNNILWTYTGQYLRLRGYRLLMKLPV